MRRLVLALTALCVLGLAGCASVPGESPVKSIKKISDGEWPAQPPGPGDKTTPQDLVRGFINASGSSDNRHAAARQFLTLGAQNWDDSASLTVVGEQFDTITASASRDNRVVVLLRGKQLGKLMPNGAFEPLDGTVEQNIEVVSQDGQWRIATPPSGTVVRLPDMLSNFKKVRTYFLDPTRHRPVADVRYLAAAPARTLPARVVRQLLGGPSEALTGAAVSAIPRTARLRSNVAVSSFDDALIVDLTDLGNLDENQRWLLAAQVVLSLTEVNVMKVRLLADGAPLLPKQPVLTREAFSELEGADDPRPDVPGLVVVGGGKVRTLVGAQPGMAVDVVPGGGGLDLASAAMSPDGQQLAAVSRQGGRTLWAGRLGGPLVPVGVQGATLTRPSWAPGGTELWCVRNGGSVVRVVFDGAKHGTQAPVEASALTALGTISDLRLSQDGMRVAAVVGGRLAVGAVQRQPDGLASVRNVRILRASELTSLICVDWRAPDQLAAAGRDRKSPVVLISMDGLDLHPLPGDNLTPPLTSIASSPGRPLLVTDQNGLWSFGMDDLGTWQQLTNGTALIAAYPG